MALFPDILIGLALGTSAGLALGLWLGARRHPAQPNDRLEQELRAQLAAREGEVGQLRTTLAESEAARTTAETRLADQATLHAQQFNLHRESTEQALENLRTTFKALSLDALKNAQPEFLRLAQETLSRFHEMAKSDLAQRQQSIAHLLDPLTQQLQAYDQRVQHIDRAQAGMLGEVQRQLLDLTQQSQALSAETLQLRRVLSSNQARGRWGEDTLRRVVESAGLSAHCDFTEQVAAEERKPDLVVHLPGQRAILVDAKVPDLDFLETLNAPETNRAAALEAHATKLRSTIKALADRDYPARFPEALDHVVLFLPAESLLSSALEGDPDLAIWAARKRILLATPISLIGLLRAIAIGWQQHDQSVNAREIANAAKELYSRVARFTAHLAHIQDGLSRATAAYNDAVGSYERMVRPSGERLSRLGTIDDQGSQPSLETVQIPLRSSPTISNPVSSSPAGDRSPQP